MNMAHEGTAINILLVEDDVLLASGIKLGLVQAGYAVDWVGSAERALERVQTESFDMAVIDLGLPAMDGLALTQALRQSGQTMPVLILTARDALEDRVQGLDQGADDYMVKPCELPELLARLRALLRRSQAATSAVLRFGPLLLDLAHRSAAIVVPADGTPLAGDSAPVLPSLPLLLLAALAGIRLGSALISAGTAVCRPLIAPDRSATT